MLYLFILQKVIADLVIRSPSELAGTVITVSLAEFGSPPDYPIEGQLYFVSESPACSFSSGDLTGFIAIGFIDFDCYYSDMPLKAQQLGALGMIIVQPIDDINYFYVARDNDTDKVNIPAVVISNTDGKMLLNYTNNIIWATYSYNFTPNDYPIVEFFMSGNYTLDKEYEKYLAQAYQTLGISAFDLVLVIAYYSPGDIGVNSNTDCIDSYCIPNNGVVTGSTILQNTFIIYDYFLTIPPGNFTSFFNFLTSLYESCEFDYSQSCISSVLKTYNSGITYYVPQSFNNYPTADAPLIFINDILFFWTRAIENAICLSSNNPPSSCPSCSPGCSSYIFASGACSLPCNTSSCGYQNFVCINNNGCFDFMLGDGQCDSICKSDPDCKSSGSSAVLTALPGIVIGAFLFCFV